MPVVFPFPTRPSVTADADVLARVRLILTGDSTSTSPAEADVVIYQSDVEDYLYKAYPCLGTEPVVTLDDRQVRAYQQGVAYLIAAKLVQSPGGQEWARYVIQCKQGQVDEKYSITQTVAEAAAFLTREATKALKRITCIAAGLTAPSLFVTSGARTEPTNVLSDPTWTVEDSE